MPDAPPAMPPGALPAVPAGAGSLVIRRATAADWPALWSIFHAVVARGDTYTFAPETSEPEARRLWTGPGLATYVALDGDDVVGTYFLKANQPGLGDHVANAGYMVRPDRFGRGVGWAMGEHSLAAARAAGFRAMQFNAVVSTNVRAVALWRRLGFTVVGTIPAGFRHATLGDVDLYVMHRLL